MEQAVTVGGELNFRASVDYIGVGTAGIDRPPGWGVEPPTVVFGSPCVAVTIPSRHSCDVCPFTRRSTDTLGGGGANLGDVQAGGTQL